MFTYQIKHTKLHLANSALAVALLTATYPVLAGEAGRLMFASGHVLVAGQPASTSHVVMEGDDIVTDANSHAHLKTIDSGYLIVRPGSHVRVISYHVDTKNPANTRIKLELLQGVARSVSGQAVQQAKENFRFNTPVAAIGVRGTDFTVYTNKTATQVIVATGGVVVSGFDGSCGPAGAGPCEGANSRELFASQSGQLLQVLLGRSVPQLLRSNSLVPDLAAPPKIDEPNAKAPGIEAITAKSGAVITAAQADLTLVFDPSSGAKPPVLPEKNMTPPAEPPYGKLVWGRWQALIGQPANFEFIKAAEGNAKLLAIDSYFAVMRTPGADWQLPSQGTMSFALGQSEAFILTGAASLPLPAALENGMLKIDFSKSAFATGFDLISQGKERLSLKSVGYVSPEGRLLGASQFSNGSNMQVNGAVSPENGGKAAYIFQSRIDADRLVIGGTSWYTK